MAEHAASRPVAKEPARTRSATARRRLWADSAARWIVTAGGLAIIASILGILLFILVEVLPLIFGTDLEPGPAVTLDAGEPPLGVLADEYRTHAALLTAEGRLNVVRLGDGARVLSRRVLGTSPDEDAERTEPIERLLSAAPVPGQQMLSAATSRGAVVTVKLAWEVRFEEQRRVIEPGLAEVVRFELDPRGLPLRAFAARIAEDGTALAVGQTADGHLQLVRREVEQNFLSGELSESWQRGSAETPLPLSHLVIDADQRNIYAGSPGGELLWWRVDGVDVEPPEVVAASSGAVTALSMLIGDCSLVVGRDSGALEIWFPVRQPDESFRLTRIREFPAMPGSVRLLAPSMRDKGFLAQDESGELALLYSTSHRTLHRGPSPLPEATALFYAPKADGAILAGPRQLAALDIDNAHPEVSWGSLFSRVWYEGYAERAYVWQSSGGTDEFEPKLSLMPLMIGTLKGTVYSLFLAIPLGVLGAMYTSQFMHPSFKRYVKPAVEIMAALPSVVLGFLAGLWLAPRIQQMFPALMLMLLILPLAVLATGLAWSALPQRFRGRFPAGLEALLYGVVLCGAMGLCLSLGPGVERLLFGGSFQAWLLETTGLGYDQRNAIVVGLAMGFAVIPIIFSIAEDAFSNVPRDLVSGSLALGANRWQTVTRVVLPTASPGIFSAVMIGFGRAVGETMIVLMATGNTPLMDWNPFNGFRTLAANIAVEIPEAPHGGTLYRTLFLAALILFIFTFLINTVAEIVRQRLRARYAQL